MLLFQDILIKWLLMIIYSDNSEDIISVGGECCTTRGKRTTTKSTEDL